MAKGPINERVKPEFTEIYELLHKGFVNEKLVVPESLIHDVETSMAPHYRERIVSYQNYLGQVRLFRSEEVANRQTDAALQKFCGNGAPEVLKIRDALLQDPDQRMEQLNVTVDRVPHRVRLLRAGAQERGDPQEARALGQTLATSEHLQERIAESGQLALQPLGAIAVLASPGL